MLPPMRARTVTAAAIFAFCTAFQSTTFDGCGAGPGPAVPVPPSPDPVCIDDDGCPPTECEDRRCVAGRCLVVAARRDADGDGVGPPPCGGDCDDSDPRVGPGEPEACDGLDQDCDGTIDEGAPPAAVRRVLALAERTIRASAFGDAMLVLETGFTDGLSARVVTFEGTAGAEVEIETGEDPTFYDVVASDDGAIVVVHHASAGTIDAIPLTVGAGGGPVVGSRFEVADVSAGLSLLGLRAEALPMGSVPGSLVLAVAWADVTGSASVWAEGFAAPVVIETGTSVVPDLATDGTLLVVGRGLLEAVFLDPATGAEVASQTLPGAGWGADPIASGDGRAIAVVRDAFDYALTAFTTSTATALRPAPAVMPRGLPARIDSGPEFHVLTRLDASSFSSTMGVWAFILDRTSLEPIERFTGAEVSGSLTGGVTVEDFDVVVSESGAAVLTSFGLSGTAVTTFSCRSGG